MKVCFVIWPIETLIERASMDGVLEYRMSHQYFFIVYQNTYKTTLFASVGPRADV